MADTYDLLVLGGGTGGYSCALRAADLGLRVAVIEKAKLGGVCLHSGCIPTKALLQAAEVADHARDAARYGVRASFDGVDTESLQRYKQRIVDANWKGLQAMLPARGVEVIAGVGRLRDAHTVSVDTEEGRRTLSASRAIVLATGSVPIDLPLPGAETDGERIITSDHALALPRVPQRPIIIGCGAVGVEFATVWDSLGAEQVTLVEALDGLLPAEDTDTCKTLAREVNKRGIRALTSTTVTAVEKGADGVRVTAKQQGGEQRLEGDVLLVAIGRRPVNEGMGFEEAGVRLERGYVGVDGYGRTSAGGCYAIGDIIPTLGLAHASFQEGFLAAEHAAGAPGPDRLRRRAARRLLPSRGCQHRLDRAAPAARRCGVRDAFLTPTPTTRGR
jgi:dihydrolipoamide dehydrogenase